MVYATWAGLPLWKECKAIYILTIFFLQTFELYHAMRKSSSQQTIPIVPGRQPQNMLQELSEYSGISFVF